MANTIRTSELPMESGLPIGEELVEISTINVENNSSTFASKKTVLSNIGSWIFNHMPFFNLQTNNKTVVGAINEIQTNGELIIAEPNAGAHNAIYRGKCLGTVPTPEQYTAIYNGSFDDMFIGDYWYDPNEGIHWRIAGFNYYQGLNWNEDNILTNHVTIIPDEVLVGDTYEDGNGNIQDTTICDSDGFDSLFGYRYSSIRGYRTAIETFTINEIPEKGVIHTYKFPLQHIPLCILIRFNMDIYAPHLSETCPSVIEWSPARWGEDPDNPNYGYVSIPCTYYESGTSIRPYNNFELYWSELLKPENQTGGYSGFPFGQHLVSDQYAEYYMPYPPLGTEITIYYKYYDENYGALNKSKEKIFNTFGSEHILTLKLNSFFNQRNYGNEQIEDGKVEIPTTECIFGNSNMSYGFEYKIQEWCDEICYYDKCLTTNSSTYRGNTPHYSRSWHVPSSSRSINYVANHYEMYRLPLFLYNPSLIHIGYGYWLRNYCGGQYTEGNICTNYQGYNFRFRTMAVDTKGNQSCDTWAHEKRPYTGIRPIFNLVAIDETQPTNN